MTRALLILLIGFCCCLANAQVPFTRDVWINESGVPVKTSAIAKDSSGLLWLATDAGLFTYNGRDALKVVDNVAVTTVACSNNAIYFGCRDGSTYRFGNLRPVLLFKASASVSTIVATPYGLLAGTLGDGIYGVDASGVHHFNAKNGLPDDYVYSIANHKTGVIFGTDLGFFKASIQPAKGLVYDKIKAFDDIGKVVRQEPGTANRFWLAFAEKGLVSADVTGATNPIYGTSDTFGTPSDLLFRSPDLFWIVTEKGWLVKAERLAGMKPVLFIGKKINAITADTTGNLWLATSQGLTMVSEGYLQHLDIKTPFSLEALGAMVCDKNNEIYYTEGKQLLRLDIGTNTAKTLWESVAPINCLYIDPMQRMWIGTSGKGMLRRDPDGTTKTITVLPQLKDAHVLCIAGNNEKLWVSSLNGVEEFTLDARGNIVDTKHHGKRDGIGSDYVYRIFIDSKKRVWFATDGAGLSMYDGNTYQRWNKAHGFERTVVYGITEDVSGNIWVATLDGGLYKYDGKKWQQLSKTDGLQDATVYAVAANRSGQVMAVTAKGIDIWYPGDGEFRHVNRRSGLGIDSTSGMLNAAVQDTGGNVWIPYQKGFLVFKNQEEANQIHPAVVINSVSLFSKVLDSPVHTFAYDQNQLSFRFQGISFAHPDRLRYRYRLEGFNNEFIETTDQEITYTQLPPGTYRFCIQATMHDTFEHQTWDSYSFVIEAPVWGKWWFWLLIFMLVGTGIYALVRWRVRSLQRVAQLRHERMSFEYEHLKSQVNPHFLFNSLNTLASLIEEDPEAAISYTVQLSDLYRDTLTFHKQDLVPLEEEWSVLERYFYIQHSRFGDALQLKSSVSPAVKQHAKIIPLALQLLVENAIKHNVVSRTAPLIIFIDATENELIVRNVINPKTSPEKGTGLGLSNIKQRYARITDRAVYWMTNENEFIVVLPLL